MDGTIALGADHAGFELKEIIKATLDRRDIPYVDVGVKINERCDYPEYAGKVAQLIQQGKAGVGILCCGSGVGVSIAANRFSGIRAVVCHDIRTAMMSRKHNDANVICFGGHVVAPEYALELLDVFLGTSFDGGRHQARVAQLDGLTHGESLSC